MWSAIRSLWTTTWHAIIVWCMVAPVFAGLAYGILAPALRRVLRKQTSNVAEAV
jgi:hypothetical protein